MNSLNEPMFRYFKEISNIPRGSGNTKAIADYCVDFAKKHNLEYYRDKSDNVVIYKNASPGREEEDVIMLAGHTDMVCVSDSDCDIDMKTEGLKLKKDGDLLFAEGTSLGGDDGIALAMIFSVLENDKLSHPPIEAVLTSDEEIGMIGANALDESVLKGKMMLNIDSEKEGILTVGCAGGILFETDIPIQRKQVKGNLFKVNISGLASGHSGVEIHHSRANANILAFMLAEKLIEGADAKISYISGGTRDNVIPKEAELWFVLEGETKEKAAIITEGFFLSAKEEFKTTDPDMSFSVKDEGIKEISVFDSESEKRVMEFLLSAPQNVIKFSESIENLVQTSLNMGILLTNEESVKISFLIRSSINKERDELCETLTKLSEKAGAKVLLSGKYSAWEFNEKSVFLKKCVSLFEEMYEKKPEIEIIHAGLECGVFAGKIKGFDGVSIGPDMYDIHTSSERLSISSARRVMKYIENLLEK